MVRREAARLVHRLAGIDMESLGVVLHGLLVERATCRIHALIARLQRGDLVRAVLLLLLVLIVEKPTLHRVPMVRDHCLDRVVLLVRIHQRVLHFMFVSLVVHHLHLVVRRGEVIGGLTLLTR